MNELAKALNEYKEREDLSLRALAERLGVQHGTAETWLKGWRKPGYENLPRIVETIDVDEITIYRWLTADVNGGKHRFLVLGIPTHSDVPIAA